MAISDVIIDVSVLVMPIYPVRDFSSCHVSYR